MKKKFVLLPLLCIPALTLTACSDFLDMFYFGGNGIENGGYQSISAPPAGDDAPHYAPTEYTYASYIKNNCYPISSTPAVGQTKLLVIPVWFTDSTNFINIAKRDGVRDDIRKAYFGTEEETGWRSVKSYYEEESHGKLTINGVVANWYECGESYTKYAIDDQADSKGSVPKTRALLDRAMSRYFADNPGDDKKNYDCDEDGYIDGIMLIYAAPDFQAMNSSSSTNLWAYCYWIQDKSVKKKNDPGVNAFFWASYDFMYGSATVKSHTGSSYSNGDTSFSSVDAHTYIHEMGHMFGLVDYYDYTKQYDPAGGFSMQDSNIGGHDPFSSFALGWGQAYVPTSSTTINLKPFATSGELIVLKPNPNSYSYSPFDEYLALEYYTPTGLNNFDATHKYMSSEHKDYSMGSQIPGIRLWHIDARLLYPQTLTNGGHYTFNEDFVVTDPSFSNTYGVTLMMSNTYYKNGASELDYISPLGRTYSDYNLLQLIRKSKSYNAKVPNKSANAFSATSLFTMGDTFTMNDYQNQFENKGLFNTGLELGFAFEVNGCMEDFASITITKL